jgi:subtilisin family serine protease
VVLEFANDLPTQGIAQLLARNGLRQLEAQRLTLTNSTLIRARIIGARSVRGTLARLGNEAILRTGQPNYYYEASQSAGLGSGETKIAPTPVVATAAVQPLRGDPAQYALGKLNLHEAHALATGDKILIAVIDSGIDLGHPELQGVIAGSYDALDKPEPAHKHGTGIAGAIAAQARLLGAAPAARILAIRAFGAYGSSAEATSFAVVKGVEYAATHGARIINMSFNGPVDPAMARHLAGARSLGIVLIAASGNLGPKAAPQYPAADPNVIAVSATDAKDSIFKASNIGSHIAVAAPGVDILVPAPDRDYQVTSGTSFAAAHVSGVAALLLQRAPGLRPETVRQILERTAKDLGPRGRDNEYGAGLVDAYQATMAVEANATAGGHDRPNLSVQ